MTASDCIRSAIDAARDAEIALENAVERTGDDRRKFLRRAIDNLTAALSDAQSAAMQAATEETT